MNNKALLTLIIFSITNIIDASPLPIPEINYEKFTLNNGLTVVVHEDRKVPMVAVNIWYHVGSKNENVGKTGFAHLFEHLMFNGTENYNNEYFEPFEKIGATDQNGTTSNDRTNYFQNVPTNALDLALWMESERMGHILGVIDQDKLDEQRGVVQNEKRQGENQPYGMAWNTIAKSAYPNGHPYSWSVIGSMDDLNAATMDDVNEWFKKYYGPNNAVLVLAGDINLETAKIKAEEYFGDIPSGPNLPKPKKWIAKRDESKRETIFDNVPQTRIMKVWNVPESGSKESSALELAASTIAGSKNSPLYQNLVYSNSLATSVSAYYYGREIGGLFIISADISNNSSAEEVEKAIDSTLIKYLQTGPDKKALESSRTSTISSLINGLQRIGGFGGKSDILATYQTFYGDPGYYKTDYETYMNMSKSDIRDIAREWLSSGDYVLTIKPEKKTSVSESKVDRSKGIPYPTEKINFSFPEIKVANLDNGSKVYVLERNDLPLVQMQIMFDGGYAIENSDERGFVNFTMSMMDEGTKKYDALEFNEILNSLGSGIGFGSSLDTTYGSLSSLKVNLDKTLDLFKESLLNPVFNQSEIERVKKQWLARIEQARNNPSAMASMSLRPLIYGLDHPYGNPSSMGNNESISNLKRDNLVSMHKKIINPNNASIIVVGDISLLDAVDLLNKKFANWNSEETRISTNLAKVEKQIAPRIFLINKPEAIQSYITAGQLLPPTNSDDDIVIDYANYAIAGSFTSRLNMNLREDKSWSYGARAGISYSKGQRLMVVRAPVQTDKTAESIQEILQEYNTYLSSKPIEDSELDKIKRARTLRLPGQYETLGALMSGIEDIVSNERDFNYLNTLSDKRNAILLKDVRVAAEKYIDPNSWTWVIVGDLSKIEEDIRNLNIGDVQIIEF
jgi:zinc protease